MSVSNYMDDDTNPNQNNFMSNIKNDVSYQFEPLSYVQYDHESNRSVCVTVIPLDEYALTLGVLAFGMHM